MTALGYQVAEGRALTEEDSKAIVVGGSVEFYNPKLSWEMRNSTEAPKVDVLNEKLSLTWDWNYGTRNADAADLIEYLNAPADGEVTNPNGGVDWAEVRAANGHPEPYGVTRFEIGNEIGYYRQTYWMDGRGNTDWMDAYIDGGRMTFA